MAIKFNRSQTFATNGTVTAAGLHNLVDGLDIYQALITDQTNLTSVGTADELLIADADLTANDAPRAVTVQELFNDALTVGTYTDANFTANLTYGTATGNRTVSTNASITTGTINNATLGTTTGTAATFTNATSTGANITNGTVQTLTSSTATITGGTFSGSINSTDGTIGTLNSTTGTIQTLTSSTATITGGTFSGSVNATTGTIGTLNSTTGTIQNLTSSTSTVSDISTSKNIAINVATLATTSGTQLLDFTSQGYLTHSITGNITYTSQNYSEGKSLTVRITSDGTARNLNFPASWVFVGSKPTSLAASKVAILSVTSFGTTEANCVAAYAVQT